MGRLVKKKSRRMELRMKHKINKKVRQHHRDVNKAAKQNKAAGGVKAAKKRDPGVPSSHPFKEEILRDLESAKKRMDEKKARDKERRREEVAKRRNLPNEVQLAMMAKDAASRARVFDDKEDFVTVRDLQAPGSGMNEQSKRQFYKEFRKVTEEADVILEVLDARDPLGCRTPAVERMILNMDPNKKIVLVLNKVDLVPKENVEAWLKYLRNHFPTVAFKASTQAQRRNLGTSSVKVDVAPKDLLNTSECLGADTVVQLLKNYSRNQNIKTAITVGVIGYPNVGKSSVINSLKRSKACEVGATAGVTKVAQEIHIDSKVKLLDCPGIVFATDGDPTEMVLRNCVKLEKLDDPVTPVQGILRRCTREQLMTQYKVASFSDHFDFLRLVAQRRGKLGRGGIPDTPAAAMAVLQDWNTGRIKYYTSPPAKAEATVISSEVVSTWGKAFDIDAIEKAEVNNVLAGLQSKDEDEFMALESSAMPEHDIPLPPSDDDLDSDEDDMEEDDMDEEEEEESEESEEEDEMVDDQKVLVEEKRKGGLAAQNKKMFAAEELEANPIALNKQKKKALKKKKRDVKRGRVVDDDNDTYNFDEHDWSDDQPEELEDNDDDLDDVSDSD